MRVVVRIVIGFVVGCAVMASVEAQTGCDALPTVSELGQGTAGSGGVAKLLGQGVPVAGQQQFDLIVQSVAPGASGFLVLGTETDPEFLTDVQATIYPSGELRVLEFKSDANGSAIVTPLGLEQRDPSLCGSQYVAQAVIVDAAASGGYAISNAVSFRFGSNPKMPVIEPITSPTAALSVLLSGTGVRAGDKIVVEGGARTVETTTGPTKSFAVDVPLVANAKKTLYVHENHADGSQSPSVPVPIVQDSTPPSVVIDFPAEGAVLATGLTHVSGRVSDALSGFAGLQVTVNGFQAVVNAGVGTNGSFDIADIVLDSSVPTVLTAVATDAVGHTASDSVTALFQQPTGFTLAGLAGDGQTGAVGNVLPKVLAVKVTTLAGEPFAGKLVNFAVSKSDGRLGPLGQEPDNLVQQVFTDADGVAGVAWRLGQDAGFGNNRVDVTSQGIAGAVYFTASALPGPAAQINVGSGANQVAGVSSPAPGPLVAWVSDSCNGIGGVDVTFRVVHGDGGLAAGGSMNASEVVVPTDATGHACAFFTTGPSAGVYAVEATFEGHREMPARFVIRALAPQVTGTSLSGVVLAGTNDVITGVTCLLSFESGESFVTTTDDSGRFTFEHLPVAGLALLHCEGATATFVGGLPVVPTELRFPPLGFEPVLVASAENVLPSPVLLPRLDPVNDRIYDGTMDVSLTVAGIDGLKMLVAAGTVVTLPDGTVASSANPVTLALNAVHADDVPMPMPDGVASPFAWTLQPAGATFDPPVAISYPNMTGQPAGAASYFLSFNHDSGAFEIVASGRVSDDGATIDSDAGSGIAVAGWGCNCPPYAVTGECKNCDLSANGCGSKDFNVPDAPILGLCSFTPSCNTHDDCYAVCGSSKALCDLGFLVNLTVQCTHCFVPNTPLFAVCESVAFIYYVGVALGGGSAFGSAQETACCCLGMDAPRSLEELSIVWSRLSKDDRRRLGIPDPPFTDEDQDLLPDDWELFYGLNPMNPADAVLDVDEDGLTALLEFIHQLSPILADTDGDALDDAAEADASQPRAPLALGEDWIVTVNGHTAPVDAAGVFTVSNIAAPDQFGPGGPGSPPDFVSDDTFRAVGVGKVDGEIRYAYSAPFHVSGNQTFLVSDLVLSEVPPPLPIEVTLTIPMPTLTSFGETRQATLTGLLLDEVTMIDVTAHEVGTTYLTSNSAIVKVDQDGLLTAMAPGMAFITAINEGIAAVKQVDVSFGDELTTVSGFVVLEDGTPVSGASVNLVAQAGRTTTGPGGGFMLSNVATIFGGIAVEVTATVGAIPFAGASMPVEPVPGSVTDVGLVILSEQDRVLVFGVRIDGQSQGQAVAQILVNLGYLAEYQATLPADLSPYGIIWNAKTNGALTMVEEQSLVQFVQGGGSLMLSGERPCCEAANQSVEDISQALLGTNLQIGGIGDITGPYVVNSQVIFGVGSVPNLLAQLPLCAAGGIDPTLAAGNVLARGSGGVPVAAVFNCTEIGPDAGRLAIVMDSDWEFPGGCSNPNTNATSSTIANLAAFLAGECN
jgi:hypothetical protein